MMYRVVLILILGALLAGCRQDRNETLAADEAASWALSGCNQADTNAFVKELNFVLKSGNVKVLPSYFLLPLTIYKLPDGKEITFETREELIASADIFLDESVRRALLEAERSGEYFVSGEGVRLGSGELWLQCTSEKGIRVFSVNPGDGARQKLGVLPAAIVANY